jgi:hypothetical protein
MGSIQRKELLLAWSAQLVRALLDVPSYLFGDHEVLPGAFHASTFFPIRRLITELLEIGISGWAGYHEAKA